MRDLIVDNDIADLASRALFGGFFPQFSDAHGHSDPHFVLQINQIKNKNAYIFLNDFGLVGLGDSWMRGDVDKELRLEHVIVGKCTFLRSGMVRVFTTFSLSGRIVSPPSLSIFNFSYSVVLNSLVVTGLINLIIVSMSFLLRSNGQIF